MDVINTLNDELKDRHLTDVEKIRYIYRRCCEIFYFDSRWAFSDLWNDGLKNRIVNRKIDLENVNDYGVICHSMIREVLKPLIEELVGLDCYIEGTTGHSFLEVEDSEEFLWSLDPSYGDMSRIKMDLPPTGMTGGYNDQRELLRMDEEMGFVNRTMSEYTQIISDLPRREKFRMIGFLLCDIKSKYNYSDANYFLTKMMTFCFAEAATYSDRDYHFHKLVSLSDDESNDKLYYDLSKYTNTYVITEINEEKYDSLTKTLKCR